MIHNIKPKILDNQYKNRAAKPFDLFLSYKGDKVLVKENKDKLWYPSFSDFEKYYPNLAKSSEFLFTIDDFNYYLIDKDGLDSVEGWIYVDTNRFRTEPRFWRSFAGVLGWQLNRWYKNHRFCSKCGSPMNSSKKERMLLCRHCGFCVYPNISPCIIVAVYDKEQLLLTKYAGRRFKNFALIAGFVEIGESMEQAVKREVYEEVGLKVKNIKFYKSQPWPFTDTLIAGFWAELDGDNIITLQKDELSLAVWVKREDIPPDKNKISLTGEMMDAFRLGLV